MKNLIAFSVLASSVAISAAHAQVHRCTEAPGHVIYSDLPCANGQPSMLIESQKSADIGRERLTANAAAEKKYSIPSAAPIPQDSRPEFSTRPNSPAPLATTAACKSAQKELEFVSSLRTTPQDEKRMRMNAAITNVNAACGTSTPLMQEPPKVLGKARPEISYCDSGFCYDSSGGIYKKTSPKSIIGSDGRTCTKHLEVWQCT